MARLLLAAAALALCLAPAVRAYEYQELEDWVIANGGTINTYIGKNKEGYRGLFVKKDAKDGDYVATIPSATMINCGSLDSSVTTGTLIVLRELLDPHSRFKPYIKVWPKKGEILNVCTFPQKYAPLLESEYWQRMVNLTQDYLAATLRSETNADLDWTVKEVVGNAKVDIEDMKYACAVASTRYVTVEMRKRLMMVPIFDMKNHKRNCVHTTTALDGADEMHIVVGKDVKAGEELCYSYSDTMRDDYAVMNYGFLPDLEDPPRLLQIDHYAFDTTKDHQDLPEAAFDGDVAALRKELERQSATLKSLEEADAKFDAKQWPAPGKDYVFDTLQGLKQRRRSALRWEINRLKQVLTAKGEKDL